MCSPRNTITLPNSQPGTWLRQDSQLSWTCGCNTWVNFLPQLRIRVSPLKYDYSHPGRRTVRYPLHLKKNELCFSRLLPQLAAKKIFFGLASGGRASIVAIKFKIGYFSDADYATEVRKLCTASFSHHTAICHLPIFLSGNQTIDKLLADNISIQSYKAAIATMHLINCYLIFSCLWKTFDHLIFTAVPLSDT